MISKHTLSDFLNYLDKERRYSTHTLRAYRGDLEALIAFLKQENTSLENTTSQQLRTHLAHCKTTQGKPLSGATLRRKQSAIKSYYAWARRFNPELSDPSAVLQAPKKKKSLPRALDVDAIFQLLAPPEKITELSLRDHIVLILLYGL